MNTQDFFRYGSLGAVLINAALALYVSQSGASLVFGSTPFLVIAAIAFISFSGFLYIFGHAMMSERKTWAIAVFFLGPIAQVTYWMIYIFPEDREMAAEVTDVHSIEQLSQMRETKRLQPPQFIDLAA